MFRPTPDWRCVVRVPKGRVKGRAERGCLGDAVGAVEAVDGTRMIERPGAGQSTRGTGSSTTSSSRLGGLGRVGGVGVWAGGSQTSYGPQACRFMQPKPPHVEPRRRDVLTVAGVARHHCTGSTPHRHCPTWPPVNATCSTCSPPAPATTRSPAASDYPKDRAQPHLHAATQTPAPTGPAAPRARDAGLGQT
jgi:hypothetical protein